MAANFESSRETGNKKGHDKKGKGSKKVTFDNTNMTQQATSMLAADSQDVASQQDNLAADREHQAAIPAWSVWDLFNSEPQGGNFIDRVVPVLRDGNFAAAVANAVLPIMTAPGSTRVLRWRKDADGVWTLETPAGNWMPFEKST
jgi:hypothetical protein